MIIGAHENMVGGRQGEILAAKWVSTHIEFSVFCVWKCDFSSLALPPPILRPTDSNTMRREHWKICCGCWNCLLHDWPGVGLLEEFEIFSSGRLARSLTLLASTGRRRFGCCTNFIHKKSHLVCMWNSPYIFYTHFHSHLLASLL